MNGLLNWLDQRTGYRKLMHEALYENVPGGARWRYVWGSTLVYTFVVQAITGIFLWMAYSPSGSSAWESVYYIEHQMQYGWLLRGVHHFTAQAMVVLLALHLMQVIIDGAYKAPREVNFWLGLILMKIVLGLSLTGYLLPWDQKGYWATKVATKIMGTVPVAGVASGKVVVGGDDYGHHTLTRFFALHAGVLPASLVLFLALHIAVFRRHGIHAKDPKRRPDAPFFPDQVLKDAVACLGVLAIVLALTIHFRAELGAPADGASPYDAARPEWYFLFLFQFLKYFPGEWEVLGAVVIPGLVVGVMFLMPFIGRWKLGHAFNVGYILALLAGAGFLTFQAVQSDRADEKYKAAVAQAHEDAERAIALAKRGIPREGAAVMMRNDPKTQGQKLFAAKCASCHSHLDENGQGIAAPQPSAPNLYRFGSRDWLDRFFDPKQFASPSGFGKTKHGEKGQMKGVVESCAKFSEDDKQKLQSILWALSAEAKLAYQAQADHKDADRIAAGRKELASGEIDNKCTGCHKLGEHGDAGMAPDLTGWGSRAWLTRMIHHPGQSGMYGYDPDAGDPVDHNDRMPAFGKDQILTPQEIEMLVIWLRQEWDEPKK